METLLLITGIVLFVLTIFVLFFIFKSIQFVITAVNLYKEMIDRESSIIQILLDIRDSTKKYEETAAEEAASKIREEPIKFKYM